MSPLNPFMGRAFGPPRRWAMGKSCSFCSSLTTHESANPRPCLWTHVEGKMVSSQSLAKSQLVNCVPMVSQWFVSALMTPSCSNWDFWDPVENLANPTTILLFIKIEFAGMAIHHRSIAIHYTMNGHQLPFNCHLMAIKASTDKLTPSKGNLRLAGRKVTD